ncbi:MAG: fused MFS/spermidine synthase [Planctomycetota bacterium]
MPPTKLGPVAARIVPCGLAFVASFAIMVVELVAGRLIAKHVGNSLYTWTSVIGVVLAGISIGNLVGGRLADRFPARATLAVLFFAAAAACLAVPLANAYVGEHEYLKELPSWRLRIAAHVTLVFLLPSTALGLIGPVVAKLALDQGRSAGRTVGNVYAWGALGSIAGTFLTGFYLIPAMRTSGVVLGVSAVLAVVGILLMPFYSWPFSSAAALGAFVVLLESGVWSERYEIVWTGAIPAVREKVDGDVVYTDESQYSFIKITENSDSSRDLVLDNLVHAYYVPGDPMKLIYEYEEVYAAVTERSVEEGRPPRALLIGGGGYVFPRYLRARWPGAFAEVAEIDPAVTRAAVAAFGLSAAEIRVVDGRRPSGGLAAAEPAPGEAPPIEIHHLDARNHVEDLVRLRKSGALAPYDLVYGDAFNDFSVPFHLVTLEFTEKIRDLLRPEKGVYLLNVIDTYASSRFLGAVYCTFRRAFPWTYVFTTSADGPSDDPTQRETFVVVGALRDLGLGDFGEREGEGCAALLSEEKLREIAERAGETVLTDEYSPVENLLEFVARNRR